MGSFQIIWFTKGAVVIVLDKDGIPQQATCHRHGAALVKHTTTLIAEGWREIRGTKSLERYVAHEGQRTLELNEGRAA